MFRVKSKVLGHGVNGKVKQCVNKAGQKFALKVEIVMMNNDYNHFGMYVALIAK